MNQYVLDTTVLLYDAGALFAFGENTVIIPMVVIDDLRRFTKDMFETGRNARETNRHLDRLRAQGPLTGGTRLPGGGKLFVRLASDAIVERMPFELKGRARDTQILAVASEAKASYHDGATVLVTKDLNLRIKADTLGIEVRDFESEKVDIEELYSGSVRCEVPAAAYGEFLDKGEIDPGGKFLPNQYVIMKQDGGASKSVIGRFDGVRGKVVRLRRLDKECVTRIVPRNDEQMMAMDALLNDDIQMVTLVGKAGTGKTLLAVAASLYKTVDENIFSRVLVSRPTLPMGKDIGFLPGTVEEKLTPWMYPIADNVEFLMRSNGGGSRRDRPGFKELIAMGILVIEPLTYIRGRSIHNQYLIVDEAQNLTPHEIKTIITRVGDGTKVVVTGDPYQIDNPYIDSSSNGLAYLVERFKHETISAHVTLRKGERSAISELAANLL